MPVEFRTWKLEREVADIQSFDAGIMPLFDDEEARGKCGFKIIEYMSAGVPVVCSPVGANPEIVEAGKTGLFADNRAGVDRRAAVHRRERGTAAIAGGAQAGSAPRDAYSLDGHRATDCSTSCIGQQTRSPPTGKVPSEAALPVTTYVFATSVPGCLTSGPSSTSPNSGW